ncbi:MAG: hypothetical protein H6578_10970 [Chitinophagales bacterium]|nr:hypothetical protein [Chitinophagales bacterium]
MKQVKLLIAVLLLVFNNAIAQDAGTLISSANALDQTVNNALEKANNILSEQQRTLYVNLANYTSYLIGNIKYLSDDLDKKLTEKEMALLNDINTISAKLENESISWQTKLEDATVIIENVVTRIPGASKYPTPTFYKTPIISNVQNKIITIDIKGVRLNNENNYLIFNDKKVPVTSIYSDKKISFSIPLTESDVFRSDTINTFEVILHKKRLFGKDKIYKYNPRFVVVPNNIGKVKVYYKVSYQEKQTSNGQTDIVHATSGSGSTKDVEKQFNIRNSAADGWKIDKSSVKCWKESGKGDKHGYGGPYTNSMTDISFVAKAYAKRGKATCRCNWNEYRYVTKEKVETKEVAINFNTQKVEQLPKNVTSLFKTEVTYYDGSTYETSDSYFKNNYIEFRFKLLEKLIDIKFTKE